MKLLYCIFVFLIPPFLAVPANARVLSGTGRPEELAAFITIYNNYGRKTPSPRPSPSGSPSPHQAVHGATANSDSKMHPNNDLAAPQTTIHGQSDQHISRNTASSPPSAKPSPTAIHRTRAPPPHPKTSTTPTQGTRASPPPPKPSRSHEHLGRSSSTATSTSSTASSLQSANQMIEKFSGTTRNMDS
ncbi:hypothetical protein ACLB2K_066440 [Fragaria x ananassa]